MFQFIEKQKKLIQILLGLIALTFMTWGIQSYTQFRGQSDAVATVDGTKITQRGYTEALQRQQERLRAAFGNRIDPDELDTPKMRRAVLDEMIDRRLVAMAAVKSRLAVSDDAVRQAILAVPAFREKGRFSKSAYEAVLRSQGLTPQTYEANLRYQLSLSQLTTAVKGSAIPSRTVTAHLMRLLEEQREVSQALVPVKPFLSKVTVDSKQAKAYYDSHPGEFNVPERVRAQYVVLSADVLGKNIPVTGAELKQAYDSQPSRYRTDEQRRASHILIQVPADAKPEVREAALKKAQRILAEVRKSPDRFAELAKKDSQDPGSAAKGGDLGYFNRSMMVKPFADAVFALKKVGDISGVVKSEFGYHIIKLTGIQPGRTRTLDEVRGELTAQVRKQKAMAEFTKQAETFSDIVFEQPDSLQPVADRFKLKLQTSGWITRSADAAPPPLNNPKLIKSLFSDDAMNHKRNTDAVQVAPDKMVAARVLEHQSATLKKFADVREQIEKKLQHEKALKLAAKDGAAILSKLRLGAEVELKWGAPQRVSRRDPKGLSQDALRQVVAADVSKLPAYVGAEKDGAGYAIYRISKVIEQAKKTDAQHTADLSRIEAIAGTADYDAYVASLRKQADIEINKKNLERR